MTLLPSDCGLAPGATAEDDAGKDTSRAAGANRRRRRPKQLPQFLELHVSGLAGHICTVTCPAGSRIRDVKDSIMQLTGVPCHEQSLLRPDGDELAKDNVVLSSLKLEVWDRVVVDKDPEAKPDSCGLLLASADEKVARKQLGRADLLLLRRPCRQQELLEQIANATRDSDVLPIFREAGVQATQDRVVVLAAVRRNYRCLLVCSREFLSDREVVLPAVSAHGMTIRSICPTLLQDREIVQTAVMQNVYALSVVPEHFRNDRELMLMAIVNDGLGNTAFELASEELRADREVVLQAVKVNGLNIQHAAPELRADLEIAVAAVTQNERALKFVARELRSNNKVLDAAGWTQNPVAECTSAMANSAHCMQWLKVMALGKVFRIGSASTLHVS
eukprot:CAMPEP_0115079618 /NCGR_PEP_ID=MMETSP0227-20121206/18211_1 /TAXON_ID=89957 /ORGANISM="Polarella glacialis, Strain CCMP 1383" /LENGTH=389 /DNA_ID=CAMNT_0002467147 /DNA_START=71 /DNA_END=1240 /DNA_ORIENTATION=+